MDNRDFLPYMLVAKMPPFTPALISSSYSSFIPSHTSSLSSLLSRLLELIRSFYRHCYAHLHDIVVSSLFGCLTLNEKLYVAVHENDVYRARILLAHGASPGFTPVDYKSTIAHLITNNNNNKNSTHDHSVETSLFSSILAGDSMLYMAVSNNNFRLIQQLLTYHDYGQSGQHTEVVALCLAAKQGYFPIVKYLIDYGHINPNDHVIAGCKHCKCNPEEIQRYQFPLYHACRGNHFSIVKYLIEMQQCDINQLTTTYETSLHGAILGAIENRFDTSYNNQQRFLIVKYLLSRMDCNPNLGLNPLCVSLAHDNIYDYTSLLLQYNCDVNRLGWNRYETKTRTTTNDEYENNLLYPLDHPLNICLQCLLIAKDAPSITDNVMHKKHALKLINNYSNIYAMYDRGLSYPLLLAVETGDIDLVEAMLKRAKSLVRMDIIEPLVQATMKSYYDIVKIFIEFGFNPNTIMMDRNFLDTKSSIVTSSSSASEFLASLDQYHSFIPMPSVRAHSPPLSSSPESARCCRINNLDQQLTPFLALARLPNWIFHPDKFESTMKTVDYLFSRIPINFSIHPNRIAFQYALIHEHVPLVYFCLANSCPIYCLHNLIDFPQHRLQTHFSYTLFHLISLTCRLASNNRIQRLLLDAYARTIIRIHTYNRQLSMNNVVAYMQLWFTDDDFVSDPIVFEHLLSLPYFDDILENYDRKQLRAMFGSFYQQMMEKNPRHRPMYSLKHICRLKIRTHLNFYANHHNTNMLEILPNSIQLSPSLRAYLLYITNRSNSLTSRLLHNEQWNTIGWM